MNAHIISIGNELLDGYTLDTNSVWISQFLSNKGIITSKKITVGDNHDEILFTVKDSTDSKPNFIFITGGLGPTHDDVTKESLSKLFNQPLIVNEVAYKELVGKYASHGKKEIDESSKKQAMILENSSPIKNRAGLAVGFSVEFNESKIIVLPGIPREMKIMVNEEISQNFFSNSDSVSHRTIRTFGISESSLYGKMKKIINENAKSFSFSFLPHYNGVDIRIKSCSNTINEKKLLEFSNKIFSFLGLYSYGYDDDKLETILVNMMVKNKCSLSIAESCTGGLLSKKITDIPGSSSIFFGGLVAYSNESKSSMLEIDQSIINLNGAVVKEISELMAVNVKKKFKTDFSISVTGISGPTGGTDEKPVGLVYLSISDGYDVIHTKEYNLKVADRRMHKELTSCIALNNLRKLIINE